MVIMAKKLSGLTRSSANLLYGLGTTRGVNAAELPFSVSSCLGLKVK